MKRILLIFASVFFLVIGTVAAQVSLDERGYLVYIPSTYDESEPMPLVIALHGYGESAASYAQATGWTETAEEYGFIIGFLNGIEQEWHVDAGSNDTDAILDFIELIANQAHIDRERVYLVGFSNGGAMAQRATCDAPDTFAAVVAVSGWMNTAQNCPSDVQTSVLLIHGTADRVIPFGGTADHMSTVDTVAYWAEQNNCTDEGVHAFDETYTGLQIQFYRMCDAGNMVMLYAIPIFGHAWPGAAQRATGRPIPNELNANFIIWGFFEISYESQQAAIELETVAGE